MWGFVGPDVILAGLTDFFSTIFVPSHMYRLYPENPEGLE